MRLFEKAAEKNVTVQIPADYVTVPAFDASDSPIPQTQDSDKKVEAVEERSGGSKMKGKESKLEVS